ncbi:ubiquitin-related domain-containing protein [Xylariaceae sp. FL1272]|nr:ubiquitin-related domain-containing protein [Xylariaceae sp. FL1272]
MADTAAPPTAGGDQGPKQERLSFQQPAGDVEMEDLSSTIPQSSNAEGSTSQAPQGKDEPIPVAQKDKPTAESSASARPDDSMPPENEDLTIDPADPVDEGKSADHDPNINIMLQLTNGARHPFRIDEKYLAKRNVNVTSKAEDGRVELASITVYTLKELILRDWRREWEEPPREPTSIRLIHFGKLLEDRNQLSHYHFKTTGINWVHLTVKPQDLLDEEEGGKKVRDSSGSHQGRSGCCVIL